MGFPGKERSMWLWKEHKTCTVHTWIWLLALSLAPVHVIKLSAVHFGATHFGESLLTLRIMAAINLCLQKQRCCCSDAQSCPTIWNPMDCSSPSFPVLHHLLEFAQTHSIESVMPSNHLVLCHPFLLLPSIFPSIRSFLMSRLFASNGQGIGASASASVLPMNIQE